MQQDQKNTSAKQETVEQLAILLQTDTALKESVEAALRKAALPQLDSLDDFYGYLEQVLTHTPVEQQLMPSIREFYFVLSQSPGDLLRKHPAFNDWIGDFVNARGNFMDDPAS